MRNGESGTDVFESTMSVFYIDSVLATIYRILISNRKL